jgi:NitT/TauT family transport system substrate-binding protein
MKTLTRRTVLAGGIALAAGCSSAHPGASPEITQLKVGAIQSVTAAGLYIAQSRGYFKAQSLDVTILPTTGGGANITALIGGAFDIYFGNYVSAIEAQARGAAHLRIIAEGNNAGPRQEVIVVPPGSPITTLADLKGKVVGVNALSSVATLLASSVLRVNGIPVSSVKFTAIPFPAMLTALQARRVDAAVLIEPFLTQDETSARILILADTDQGATQNFPISGYVATDTWAARYPRTVTAFLTALDKGQTVADTNRAAFEKVLPHFVEITPAAASVVPTGTYPTGPVNQAEMQRVANVMHQFGMIPPFSISGML